MVCYCVFFVSHRREPAPTAERLGAHQKADEYVSVGRTEGCSELCGEATVLMANRQMLLFFNQTITSRRENYGFNTIFNICVYPTY